MYKLLKIEKYSDETFFTLKNIETGTEVRCFEPFNFEYELKEFSFLKEAEIYDCLIAIDVDVKNKKEDDSDIYYHIMELNKKIGDFEFAKLKLNNDIYYVLMRKLKHIQEIEDKKTILLRRIDFHLLKVNDVISDTYKKR